MDRQHALGADDPRVALAIERTYLAWVRTALAMMGFGFVVARSGILLTELSLSDGPLAGATPSFVSIWTGIGLIVAGLVVQIGAALRYQRQFDALAAGSSSSLSPTFGHIIAVVLTVLGLVTAANLVLRITTLEPSNNGKVGGVRDATHSHSTSMKSTRY